MILRALSVFITVLEYTLFARVILSWLPIDLRSNRILAIIYTITDPILLPIKKMLDNSPLGGRGMPIDISPVFAFFLLQLVQNIISYLMVQSAS